MRLRPPLIPERPQCCAPYENVWITEDGGSRVKVPYNEYFKRQVGYGFYKPEPKPSKDCDTRPGNGKGGEKLQQQNSPNSYSGNSNNNNDIEDWKRGNEFLNQSNQPQKDSNRKDKKQPATQRQRVPPKDPLGALVQEVTAILNKITPQTFDKLTGQLCEISIATNAMLDKVISIIFQKAVLEPNFSNLYAEMCARLEKESRYWAFLQVVHNVDKKVFFWVKDLDFEPLLAGPYRAVKDCVSAAEATKLPALSQVDFRLQVQEVLVTADVLLKIFKNTGNDDYYFSYMPFVELDRSMISEGTFASLEAAQADALKKNSFRRRLLNVCQEEFTYALKTTGVYGEFEIWKQAALQRMATLGAVERLEEQQLIDERQLGLKKRKLGNIRFIGELCKIGMLKPTIMFECFNLMLADTDEEGNVVRWKQQQDEQYLEALCHLLRTVGGTLEATQRSSSKVHHFEDIFNRIRELSKDKSINSRIRFNLEEILELRQSGWRARRETEGPATIDQIHQKIAQEDALRAASADAPPASSRAAQPVAKKGPESRGGSSDNLVSIASKLAMSDDALNKCVRSLIEDFVVTGDTADISEALRSELPKRAVGVLVLLVLTRYTDTTSGDCRKRLLLLLESLADILVLSRQDVEAALWTYSPLITLCDFLNDLRDAPELIGDIVGALIRINACSIRAIRDFVNAIKKSCLADEYNIHDIDFIEQVYLRFLTVCLR